MSKINVLDPNIFDERTFKEHEIYKTKVPGN